jgi:hypothetical protein
MDYKLEKIEDFSSADVLSFQVAGHNTAREVPQP